MRSNGSKHGHGRDEAEPEAPIPYKSPPIEVLPEAARDLVKYAARAIDCDPGFVLLPVLGAMSGAIGASRVLALRPGQVESALLWTAVVAESGTGKSPGMRFASAPIRAREKEARKQWRAAMREYKRAMDKWLRDQRRKNSDPGDEPEMPPEPRFYTSDATMEKIASMLEATPRGFLMERDELSAWFAMDRYSKSKGAEQAQWLSIHSGQTLCVDRKNGTRIFVDHPYVPIVGGVQPGVLRKFVEMDPTIVYSGLLGRVLIAWPPTWPRKWDDDGVPDRVQRRWSEQLAALYGLEMEPAGLDEEDGVRPVVVGLTEEAKQVWREWFAKAQEGRETAPTASERAAWAKIETAAARLALIIHLARQASDRTLGATVDRVSMVAGVRLAEWFAREAARVYGMLWSAETDVLSRLFERVRIAAGEHGVTAAEWAKRTMRGDRRNTEVAEAQLQQLVQAGLAVWKDVPGASGQKPARRLVIAAQVTCVELPCPPVPFVPLVGGEGGQGGQGGQGDTGTVNEAEEPGTESPAGSGPSIGSTSDELAADVDESPVAQSVTADGPVQDPTGVDV